MALNDVLALLIDDYDPEAFYDGEEQIQKEAMIAFYDNQPSYFDKEESEDVLESFRESFVGWFAEDNDFARDMADQWGTVLVNQAWPFSCIDWDQAARELLYDVYWSDNGYYFRDL